MPVKWKICDGCGRKYNEIVEECPHCHSKSFTDYEKSKKEDTTKNVNSEGKKEDTAQNAESESKKDDTAKNVNSEGKKEDTAQNAESESKKQEDDVSNNSQNKFKEDLDKFSNNVKKAGNDFLYKNLPEEYADKLKNDFNNFSQYAGEVATNISDSTFKIGEGFVNDNISKESQEKIKQHGENISNSTKKFIEDTSATISNIYQHRQKIRNEKKEQKRKEKEEKKRKKEEERRERQRRREEERRRREEKINRDHERGVSHFKKGVEYYNNVDFAKCHQELEASFDLLKKSSSYYSAAKLYYSTTFLAMTNGSLSKDPTYVFTVMDMAVNETPNAVDSFDKNDSYCRNALNEFKRELFMPTEVDYFNLDFSTPFGQKIAGGWLLITLECQKIDSDYRYEKFKGDLFGRTGRLENAIPCFESALEYPDCDFRVWGYLAQSLKAVGRYSEANDCFSRLNMKLDEELRKDPNNIYLLREKAITFASMGLKDRALMIYDQILEIDPSADFVQGDIEKIRFL